MLGNSFLIYLLVLDFLVVSYIAFFLMGMSNHGIDMVLKKLQIQILRLIKMNKNNFFLSYLLINKYSLFVIRINRIFINRYNL